MPQQNAEGLMIGNGGISVSGREVDYATELWLEGPTAFWLHPEGPLSDTTPEEWRKKQPTKVRMVHLLPGECIIRK